MLYNLHRLVFNNNFETHCIKLSYQMNLEHSKLANDFFLLSSCIFTCFGIWHSVFSFMVVPEYAHALLCVPDIDEVEGEADILPGQNYFFNACMKNKILELLNIKQHYQKGI